MNPHLVCHVDKYSPGRNFGGPRDGRRGYRRVTHVKIYSGGGSRIARVRRGLPAKQGNSPPYDDCVGLACIYNV